MDELGELSKEDPIDFTDIDFVEIEKSLRSGPAVKYLPPPNPEYKKLLPPLNEKGEYEHVRDGHTTIVPATHIPMVNYIFYNYSASGILPAEGIIFERIWRYIERFVRWVLGLKRTLQGQILEILRNADEHYQEFRNRLKELKKEYENEPLFEIVLLVPDLFVYLCRLLADENVPKEYKVELALALIYLVSPIDLIPEGLINHPIAFIDDVSLVLFVIKRGFDGKYVSRELVEKHWPGEVSVVDKTAEWYQAVRDVLGEEFINKMWEYLKGKHP